MTDEHPLIPAANEKEAAENDSSGPLDDAGEVQWLRHHHPHTHLASLALTNAVSSALCGVVCITLLAASC